MSILAIANPTSVAILLGLLAASLAFIVIILLKKLSAGKPHAAPAAPAAPVLNAHNAVPPPPPAVDNAAALVAVLAAAAYEMLGEPVRIVSVRSVPDAWSLEGRHRLFNSHHPLR